MRLVARTVSFILLFLAPTLADSKHDSAANARPPVGTSSVLELDNARIVIHVLGEGPELVMFASAGREASDFNELALGIVDAGYRITLFDAPGINGAAASVETPTLLDLADDVGRYLATRSDPVVLVGHAFGNRLARATATQYPDAVRGVVLIGAGGLKPIPPAAAQALNQAFDIRLSADEHRAAVRYGFFAEANAVPDYWLRGWHGATGALQGAATRAVDSAVWWAAGGRPLLVIAGMQDTIAPPEDTIDLLEAELGEQVTAVRIDGAGHALLPEAPERILEGILDWLDTLDAAQP